MTSKKNEKRSPQALLPGNPGYPPSQSWLTLGYGRSEGKHSPPLSASWAEGLQLGQKAREASVATKTGKFNQTGKIFFFHERMSQNFQFPKEEGAKKKDAEERACIRKLLQAG